MKPVKAFSTALLLFTVVAFAQTKEETVAWLHEKLSASIYVEENWSVKNLEVSPCEISWTTESQEEYEHGHSYVFTSFNPAQAGSWSSRDNLILSETEIVYSRDYSGNRGSYVEHGLSVFFLKKGSEGLAQEITEKLIHLARFCKEEE